MIIKFKIDNQTIRATNYNTVVADSVNFVGASFSFDEEWEGFIKTVTFTNLKTHVEKSILLGNEMTCTCHIPWEVLQDEDDYGGKLNVYVEGFYNGAVATTATMRKPLSIKDSGRNECCFPSPTPDIYQQILNRLNWLQSKMLSEWDIQLLISERVEHYLENYLAKDNIEKYTPTEDYQPATKKYVDEHTPGILNPDDPEHPTISVVVPHIDPDTKHWFIGNTDTGVVAEGKDGKNGADGKPGEQGLPGVDGKDGVTPHIGDNGNWFIGDVDTQVPAKGQDGQPGESGKDGETGTQGPQGLPGADGENGMTPYIGENGNWFIGNVDTEVLARGQNGITPHISENGNWFIGETDTGISAGAAPVTDDEISEEINEILYGTAGDN